MPESRKLPKVFICYSFGHDRDLAANLREAIHLTGKPWWRVRVVEIFLDTESVGAGSSISDRIKKEIRATNKFLFIARPEALERPYIVTELREWADRQEEAGVSVGKDFIVVHSSGSIERKKQSIDIDVLASTALPDFFKDKLRDPYVVDLTWVTPDSLKGNALLRDDRFRDSAIKIAAEVRGVEPYILVGDHERNTKRIWQMVAFAAFALTALVFLAAFLWISRQQTEAAQAATMAIQARDRGDVQIARARALRARELWDDTLTRATALAMPRSVVALEETRDVMCYGLPSIHPEISAIAIVSGRRSVSVADDLSSDFVEAMTISEDEIVHVDFHPVQPSLLVGTNPGSTTSVGEDGLAVVVYDTMSNQIVETYRDINNYAKIETIALSADERYLAVECSGITTWMLADPSSSRRHYALDFASDVEFHPSDSTLASLSHGELRLWNAGTNTESTHRSPADAQLAMIHGSDLGLAWSGDGKYIAVGSSDGRARLFDAAVKSFTLSELGHGGAIHDAVFDRTGRFLFTAGGDNSIGIWTIPELRLVEFVRGFPYDVRTLEISSDNSKLYAMAAAAAQTEELQEVEISAWRLWLPDNPSEAAPEKFAPFLPDNLVPGLLNDLSILVERPGQSIRLELPVAPDLSDFAAGQPDSLLVLTDASHTRFLVQNAAGEVVYWDTHANFRTGPIVISERRISGMAFTPDSNAVVFTVNDLEGIDWNGKADMFVHALPSLERVHSSKLDTHSMSGLVFSSDGSYAAGCNITGTVYAWRVSGWEQIDRVGGELGHPVRIAWLPDSVELAITGNNVGRIWNVETGATRSIVSVPRETLSTDIAVSPDGTIIAAVLSPMSTQTDRVLLVDRWSGSVLAEIHTHRLERLAENRFAASALAKFSKDGAALNLMYGGSIQTLGIPLDASSAELESESIDRTTALLDERID